MSGKNRKNNLVTGAYADQSMASKRSLSTLLVEKERIQDELDNLPAGLQIALSERFGLDGEKPKSDQEIASEYHCSEGEIKEVCDYALRTLIYKKRDSKTIT